MEKTKLQVIYYSETNKQECKIIFNKNAFLAIKVVLAIKVDDYQKDTKEWIIIIKHL